MPLQRAKVIRFFLWLLGTLVIGALGNGLWEIGKPALVWVTSAILDVATLGLTSLRDSMYVEIARGTYERAAEKVLLIILGICTGAPIGIYLLARIARRSPSVDKAKLLGPPPWLFGFLVLAVTITLLVQSARMVYIVRAANHMEQIQRVVAPFISEHQRLVYASRFATIETREEYVALQGELASIVLKNNSRVPDFDIY